MEEQDEKASRNDWTLTEGTAAPGAHVRQHVQHQVEEAVEVRRYHLLPLPQAQLADFRLGDIGAGGDHHRMDALARAQALQRLRDRRLIAQAELQEQAERLLEGLTP